MNIFARARPSIAWASARVGPAWLRRPLAGASVTCSVTAPLNNGVLSSFYIFTYISDLYMWVMRQYDHQLGLTYSVVFGLFNPDNFLKWYNKRCLNCVGSSWNTNWNITKLAEVSDKNPKLKYSPNPKPNPNPNRAPFPPKLDATNRTILTETLAC